MKLLITGGSGFIGSNYILQQLSTTSNHIINLDKLTYAGRSDNLSKISNNSNYQFVNDDICNQSIVSKLLNEFNPDFLINFAAESHVDRSIDNPMSFIETNVVGTAVLLEEAYTYWSKNKKFRFLQVSTDEVFGSTINNDEFFSEESRYNPSSPYSASKASADHLVRAWHKSYGLPILITNCSNNYGSYQFPEKLIPLMIINCIDEKPLPIYGNGLNVRDWLFVNDHCKALNKVIVDGEPGSTYNIGGNNEITNIDLVKNICLTLDKLKPRSNNETYQKLITHVEDRPGHDFRYAIDASKIKKELGWVPKETFDTGIRKTISWYLNNENWWRNIQKNTLFQKRLGLKK